MTDEDVDDDVLHYSGLMCMTATPTHCRAHLEYVNAWFSSTKEKKMYAISDSGADAITVGSAAKVVSYTSRKAVILGYDPESMKLDLVPIVTALLKVQPPNAKGYPVLLCIHEAPYLKDKFKRMA